MAQTIKKYSKKALVLSIIFSFIIGYFLIFPINAATIARRELRISDSRPSQTGVVYDFLGDTTAGTTGGNIQCIKIQFCDSANRNSACVSPTGIDALGATVYDDPLGVYVWNVFNPTQWAAGNQAANYFELTHLGGGESGNKDSSWVVNGIVNPSVEATSFSWIDTYNHTDCATDPVDSGVVAFATVSGVTVSANIAETLTFSVNAVDAGICPTLGGTKITTTASTVPFSSINLETFYDGCQDLRITTNAPNGYDVSAGQNDLLKNLGGTPIDNGSCGGGCTRDIANTWPDPNFNGFGYCMVDQDPILYGNGAATADPVWAAAGCGIGIADDQLFKTLAVGTSADPRKRAIMQSNLGDPVVSDDRSYIGFRLTVDAGQELGFYSAIIVYIATPRY